MSSVIDSDSATEILRINQSHSRDYQCNEKKKLSHNVYYLNG